MAALPAKRLKVGVLISGRGSTLQALLDACAGPAFPAEIVLTLSNRAGAFGLRRAEKAGVPTVVEDHEDFETREAFDRTVDSRLRAAGVEFVCLAGFMRVLSKGFVERWRRRMVNIHPSLLPSFKGLRAHKQAIEAGVKLHGCTVHYVEPALDNGPIVAQAAVPVLAHDTPETLAARVREQERLIYPMALKLIAEDKARLAGGGVLIDDQGPPGALINPSPR